MCVVTALFSPPTPATASPVSRKCPRSNVSRHAPKVGTSRIVLILIHLFTGLFLCMVCFNGLIDLFVVACFRIGISG